MCTRELCSWKGFRGASAVLSDCLPSCMYSELYMNQSYTQDREDESYTHTRQRGGSTRLWCHRYLSLISTASSRRRAKDGFGESAVSKLSEFFGPHQVLGRDLSKFLSAFNLHARANSPSLPQNSCEFPLPKQCFRPFLSSLIQGNAAVQMQQAQCSTSKPSSQHASLLPHCRQLRRPSSAERASHHANLKGPSVLKTLWCRKP